MYGVKILSRDFYFIRHGETDYNLFGRPMGFEDVPLNNRGRAQAESLPEKLQKLGVTHLATSPLLRALETANIINKYLKLPMLILKNLQECRAPLLGVGNLKSEAFNDPMFYASILDSVREAQNFASLKLQRVAVVSHAGVYVKICKTMGWSPLFLKNCQLVEHKFLEHENSWQIALK